MRWMMCDGGLMVDGRAPNSFQRATSCSHTYCTSMYVLYYVLGKNSIISPQMENMACALSFAQVQMLVCRFLLKTRKNAHQSLNLRIFKKMMMAATMAARPSYNNQLI